NLGLVYKAAGTGNMDVVLAYSTDGRIKEYNLKVLEDDKKFFPQYDASPVIRDDVLERYTEIEDITKRLENQISTEEMKKINNNKFITPYHATPVNRDDVIER